MLESKTPGQIITFYSYKGGTGRSMTLANIACILAERTDLTPGKGILMMDWDLEAPGLHRYFFNRLAPKKRSRADDNCDSMPGLIDLFYDLKGRIDEHKSGTDTPESIVGEEAAAAILNEINLDQYIIPTNINQLSLIKAGRFNPDDTNEYPERVNKFNWEELYQKSPQLIRVFAEVLAEKYDYVLIDSRTGVTDISGVCTMLLPEKLVVVFTPNMQSLMGVVDVVRRATEYRKESDDLRSLVVFPLVSRVEANEPALRHNWRYGYTPRGIKGYQAEFESVLAEAYHEPSVKMDAYFDEMQIQHIPRYAYGEEIAVLEEKSEDKFSLRRSYRSFTDILLAPGLPWEELEKAAPPSTTYVSAEAQKALMTRRPLPLGAKIMAIVLGLGLLLFILNVILIIYFEDKPSANGVNNAANAGNSNNLGVNTNAVNANGERRLRRNALSPEGQWTGTFTTPAGANYSLVVFLNDDGNGIDGQIVWTVVKPIAPSKQNKIGMSATEYVMGEFDPKTRELYLDGYKKDDPNDALVGLDLYDLTLSADGQRLSGRTSNEGKNNGRINLTRLMDASAEPAPK